VRRRRAAATAVATALLTLAGLTAGATSAGASTTAAGAPPLRFGIYPGGYAGGGSPDPKPDDPARIISALNQLQARPGFIVRGYVGYNGTSTDATDAAQYFPFLGRGRRLDLVLAYPGHDTPLDGWLRYVRNEVRFAGPRAASISLGLMRDDYTPKTAFSAYRELICRL